MMYAVCRSGRGPFLAAMLGLAAVALPAHAQQNLFNVPSAEITPKNAIFFQQQFNANRSSAQSNTTISYGLGGDAEVGLNVFSLGLFPERAAMSDPAPPMFLFNAQKGFDLGETFKLGLGTQVGVTTPDQRNDERLSNFSYLTGVAELPDDRGKLYAGAYFASPAYRGRKGDPVGFMLGYDIPVIKDRFNLMGDYISGTSGISVAVFGGVLQMTENWQLSLGVQVPSPGSHNSYGGVLELTFVPGNKSEGKGAGKERDPAP